MIDILLDALKWQFHTKKWKEMFHIKLLSFIICSKINNLLHKYFLMSNIHDINTNVFIYHGSYFPHIYTYFPFLTTFFLHIIDC